MPREQLAALLLITSACTALACSGDYRRPFSDEEQLGRGVFAVKTVCPQSGTLTTGIDVSKWQSSIDWAAVKAGGKVKFAITRASHGVNTVDSRFDYNFKAIRAQGLLRGVYQYFEPGQDPIAQADLMLSMINNAGGLQPGDLPPVLDLETTSGKSPAVVQSQALKWLQRVEAKTGRKPMVYTAAYFSQSNIGAALKAYPLWIANYKYTTTGACPLMPDSGWSRWRIWQYSDKGSVPGISGNVDMNVFDGSLADLKAFAGATTPPPPKERPDLQLAIAMESIGGQPRDSCQSGASKDVFDLHEGQSTELRFDLTNGGKKEAGGVRVVLELDEPYLRGRRWEIRSNKSGAFQLDIADGAQSIGHDDPGAAFKLVLGRIAPSETKRVSLTFTADKASLGKATSHPAVRAWVEHMDASGDAGAYVKAAYGSAPGDTAGQTFNSGNLEVSAGADVLGPEVCDDNIDNDCNGEVDDCGGGPGADGGVAADLRGNTPAADSGTPPRSRPKDGCALGGASDSAPTGILLLLALLLGLRRRR